MAHLAPPELIALMQLSARAAGATIIDRHWHRFGEGQGCTAILLLAESHMSVHTWPEHDYAAFDIFMCGDVTLSRALSVLRNACGGAKPNILQESVEEPFYAKIMRRGRRSLVRVSPEEISGELYQTTPLLVEKISDAVKLSEISAQSLLAELVKFLVVCSKNQHTFLPSMVVDSAWQQFILFTEIYENFCQQYLSRFIHYQPTIYAERSDFDYQNTLTAYAAYYGSPPAHFWPRNDFSC
ncbi:MAG: adenosylmethionine decarboxylase [Cellvibrionaceae bacterium]|nr:adenosylmethionine decarboxylase [Cellvibrionaceae bacterium]